MEKWLQTVVNAYGLDTACDRIFLCSHWELQTALAKDDPQRAYWVYELGVRRNAQAKANIAALNREGFGHKPSGRPTDTLSRDELHSLLDSVLAVGADVFCRTNEVTEASLAKTLLGQRVAVSTAAKLRRLTAAGRSQPGEG